MSVVSVLVKRVKYDSACSEAGEKALWLLALQKTSSLMTEFVELVPHKRKTKQKFVIIVFSPMALRSLLMKQSTEKLRFERKHTFANRGVYYFAGTETISSSSAWFQVPRQMCVVMTDRNPAGSAGHTFCGCPMAPCFSRETSIG